MNQANERTEVVCVIDRSGSMESIRSDAVGGFNAFLSGQRALPGDCRLTLILFNDHVRVHCRGEDIHQVSPLDDRSYVPSGTTALLDAVKFGIEDAKSRVLEASRPPIGFNATAPAVRVVVAILTDGLENASVRATREEVCELISECRERLGWEFLFLAANQDAIQSGSSIGIDAGRSYNFTADATGVLGSFTCMSECVSGVRSASRSDRRRKKKN